MVSSRNFRLTNARFGTFRFRVLLPFIKVSFSLNCWIPTVRQCGIVVWIYWLDLLWEYRLFQFSLYFLKFHFCTVLSNRNRSNFFCRKTFLEWHWHFITLKYNVRPDQQRKNTGGYYRTCSTGTIYYIPYMIYRISYTVVVIRYLALSLIGWYFQALFLL